MKKGIEKMPCTVTWKSEGKLHESDEASREHAEKLVKDLKEKFNIDANIVGCEE